MRRRFAPLLCGVALVATGGCRNPFEPASDVELVAIEAAGSASGQGATLLVHATDAAVTPLNLGRWTARVRILVRNKVDLYLRSAAITYTDLDGNEVTAYRNIGGRNLKFTIWCQGAQDNQLYPGSPEGRPTSFELFIVDNVVVQTLVSPSYPATQVMFANLILRGEDANGYDVRLEGRITIQYLQ